MANVNTLRNLEPGTEDDHLEWESTNAYHKKSFHNRYFLAFEKVVRPLIEKVGEGAIILDSPCGSGIGTQYLHEQAGGRAKVIGIDINKDSIERAKVAYPGPGYVCSSIPEAFEIAAPSGADGIVCMEFLEHVDMATARATVEQAEKHLKPGGKVIFTSPRLRPRECYVGRNHHINEFSEQEFYYLIEEFFPLVERYSFDRYANITHYSLECNLMVAVGHKWNPTEVFT